mgnify:CR=1 FL=1
MNLFEIEMQQRDIVDELIENGGALSPELDAKMTITRELFDHKAQSYALLIKELDLDIEQLEAVIDQFKKKKATLEQSKDQLKSRLLSAMIAFDIQKFKNNMVSIWVQNSKKLKIMNEMAIPAQFLKEVVTVKVDAAGLKAALMDHTVETDAAYISEEPNLQVR